MQRSWIILVTTACIMMPIYVWSPPILVFFGETAEISRAAGKFALWMIPQLFAYALNFPIQKFLQAQRKVMVMALISAAVLIIHAFFSWLLILKLGWGLVGAAIMLNTSWWLIIGAQLLYIFITKSDGAWNGFSWLAFADLWGFVKLSLGSAVMLCLEFWYLMVLIVITGRLPNPLVPVDTISVCMNIDGWDAMIALGFNAAISSAVAAETTDLAILLGVTVLLNSLQPVLSASWRVVHTFPKEDVWFYDLLQGIWSGMIGGICLQTVMLIIITCITNWSREAEQAGSRVKQWGGSLHEDDQSP
ncbi:hypothetical protein SAY86_011015 [Trapa natans]|uniref:Protein TRANSPARENT TESTA 12 n=1 Tax=Trapa natans TaxID=22666 RepID=A0AAN7LI49_TRANT|nr:hypothetical protein SAY86_011015 [Trapa natans]